jgi:hypothetical protein
MRGRILIGAVAIALLLAGCTPAAQPSTPVASPSVTESPTPTAEPTTEPVVEALTIPECETLVPLAYAVEQFGGSTAFFGELAASEYLFRMTVPGAPEVLTSAEVYRGCSWGVPNSDGYFSLAVASITPETSASLQSALAEAGFSGSISGDLAWWNLEAEGAFSLVGATYILTDDVLILCDGTGAELTDAIAGKALDVVRTANPSLGL